MLTPAIDDVNRKAELKRKAQNPHAFGVPRLDKKEAEDRVLTGHILVTGDKPAETEAQRAARAAREAREADEQAAKDKLAAEEQAAKDKLAAEEQAAEAARIRKEWEEYLDQPIKALIAELPAVQEVAQLTAMSEVEAATKNRKPLIEAIAAEIAKRGE